jgi:hypothetical protein
MGARSRLPRTFSTSSSSPRLRRSGRSSTRRQLKLSLPGNSNAQRVHPSDRTSRTGKVRKAPSVIFRSSRTNSRFLVSFFAAREMRRLGTGNAQARDLRTDPCHRRGAHFVVWPNHRSASRLAYRPPGFKQAIVSRLATVLPLILRLAGLEVPIMHAACGHRL